MEKLLALLDLFRKGSSVADPAAWKGRQITVTVVAALFLALSRVAAAFGHPLPIDQPVADSLAAGLIAAVNVVLTLTTSDKVGLPAHADGGADAGPQRGGDAKPADANIDGGRSLG